MEAIQLAPTADWADWGESQEAILDQVRSKFNRLHSSAATIRDGQRSIKSLTQVYEIYLAHKEWERRPDHEGRKRRIFIEDEDSFRDFSNTVHNLVNQFGISHDLIKAVLGQIDRDRRKNLVVDWHLSPLRDFLMQARIMAKQQAKDVMLKLASHINPELMVASGIVGVNGDPPAAAVRAFIDATKRSRDYDNPPQTAWEIMGRRFGGPNASVQHEIFRLKNIGISYDMIAEGAVITKVETLPAA